MNTENPLEKRKTEICKLFANHQSIRDIAKILDQDYQTVVRVLIGQGLISERREKSRGMNQSDHKLSLMRAYLASLEKGRQNEPKGLADDVTRSLEARRILLGS